MKKAVLFRRVLGTLGVVALVATAGLLASAPGGELSRHYAGIVEPLVNEQMELFEVLTPLAGDAAGLLAACERRVLPAYREHLARARAFAPRHAVVRRLNVRLIEEYHAAISQAEACLRTARAHMAPDSECASRALAAVDMARLRTALQEIYREQGVRPAELIEL